MILHPPFIIGSTLCPALQIADATLHLLDVSVVSVDDRDRATFLLVTPTFEYTDKGLKSGVGGFRGSVDAFEAFLGFLSAAAESLKYHIVTGCKGDNEDLFPHHVNVWAASNHDEIDLVAASLQDEHGNINTSLIEE